MNKQQIKDFWNRIDLCHVNPSKNKGYDDEYKVAVDETVRLLSEHASIDKIVAEVVEYYCGADSILINKTISSFKEYSETV